jgi:hypothetical protein
MRWATSHKWYEIDRAKLGNQLLMVVILSGTLQNGTIIKRYSTQRYVAQRYVTKRYVT